MKILKVILLAGLLNLSNAVYGQSERVQVLKRNGVRPAILRFFDLVEERAGRRLGATMTILSEISGLNISNGSFNTFLFGVNGDRPTQSAFQGPKPKEPGRCRSRFWRLLRTRSLSFAVLTSWPQPGGAGYEIGPRSSGWNGV